MNTTTHLTERARGHRLPTVRRRRHDLQPLRAGHRRRGRGDRRSQRRHRRRRRRHVTVEATRELEIAEIAAAVDEAGYELAR